MRCPDCNKFVSYEDPPTVEDEDVQVDGSTITLTCAVVLNCAECGTELKRCEFEEIEELEPCDCPEDAPDWEAEIVAAEGTSRMQTADAKGKPIKPRYAKTYYGCDATVKVNCTRCEVEREVTMNLEAQASDFEESV